MYEHFLPNALQNLLTAKDGVNHYYKSNSKQAKAMVAYHIQQTFEITLKYLIYNDINYKNNYPNNRQIYTHNLELLINNFCVPYGINVPDKLIKNSAMYTSWEADSRYDVNFSVRIDSLLSAIKIAENWLISIKPTYARNISWANDRIKAMDINTPAYHKGDYKNKK